VIIPCDTVIPAIGQELDIDFTDPGFLNTDHGSYETRIPGVYIGGDAMRGASTAINAIGDGRKAVAEILEKHGLSAEQAKQSGKEISDKELKIKKYRRESAIKPAETSLEERQNFNLVISSLSGPEAIKESSRCLFCDELCNVCVTVCPNLANWSYEVEPAEIRIKKIVKKQGGFEIIEDEPFKITQKHQVLNIADWCNECGNCTTFCPTSGSPYKDKPRLCLTKDAFEQSSKGFFIEKTDNHKIIYQKQDGNISSLKQEAGKYFFENNNISVVFSNDYEIIEYKLHSNINKEFQLKPAAIMKFLLDNLTC
jgi:putative selenate reductase